MPFLGPAPFYIKKVERKNLTTHGNLARSNALISKEHEHSKKINQKSRKTKRSIENKNRIKWQVN